MACNSCEFFNAEHKWCELNDQETHCDSDCKDWAPVCLDPDNPDCSCKACQIAAKRLGGADEE